MRMVLKMVLMAFVALGLVACDKGKSSSGRQRANPLLVTSPYGSNCTYSNGNYREVFRSGYSTTQVWTYSTGYHPSYQYDTFGNPNYRYRNMNNTYADCRDLNQLMNRQGFYPYRGDVLGRINASYCPSGTSPAGFGYGVVCISNGQIRSNIGPASFYGHRGQSCSVHTDSHCDCRPITVGNTNPSMIGICWN